MSWNQTQLALYALAAVIVITWIVMVIRELRRAR